MVITAATIDQFDDFLAEYGYTVEVEEKSSVLALSLAFISMLEICVEGATDQAQCFIAYAMSTAGGSFNPAAISDDRTLIKKGLGRNAIVKEWELNDELSGTDAVTMLKRLPMAYGLLKPLLCDNQLGIRNFEVLR